MRESINFYDIDGVDLFVSCFFSPITIPNMYDSIFNYPRQPYEKRDTTSARRTPTTFQVELKILSKMGAFNFVRKYSHLKIGSHDPHDPLAQ